MLVGHNFNNASLPPGAEIIGKIYWQANAIIDTDYQLEFSFLGPDDKKYIIGEQPLSEGYPATEWQKPEIVAEGYRFRIPAVAPPGDYPMLISVLDSSGQYVGQTCHTCSGYR